MFFAHLVIVLEVFLPRKGRFSDYLRRRFDYEGCKKKVDDARCAELVGTAPPIDVDEALKMLAAARERAGQLGIHPLDPAYPELVDYLRPFVDDKQKSASGARK